MGLQKIRTKYKILSAKYLGSSQFIPINKIQIAITQKIVTLNYQNGILLEPPLNVAFKQNFLFSIFSIILKKVVGFEVNLLNL